MAINDISLTAGMRSNLTTLQATAQLLDRTQNRLSTGKKVNTAIDNPTAFFAAQSLNSRSSIIDGLKDAMGQAIQTVQAADKGIKAISSLIEQAKGVAQQAQSADTTPAGNSTVQIDLNSFILGNALTIGASTFVATSGVGANAFNVSGTDTSDAEFLMTAINAGGAYSATAEGSIVTISKAGTNLTFGMVTAPNTTSAVANTVEAASTELTSLQTQYNKILDQIDSLAADSGYKGKNLLTGSTGTGLLTVKFEGSHTLDVIGFDATTHQNGTIGGLGVTDAAWINLGTATSATIDGDLTKLDTALSTLRQNAAAFAADLSVITTRQEFSTNMVNTLSEGANKLTLADTNEEGANMLMLQTRQSLGTTALSLSAQAAQSVLRLFG
jgi:flagellin